MSTLGTMRTRLGLAALLFLFPVAACGDGETSGNGEDPAPSELTGVITEVESSGLTEVESFTLSSEGETYEIFLADDIDLGFPPAHLNEHKTTGDPVLVKLEEHGDRLFALSIEDAPAAP